ncbi:Hint domain-containing protein [Fangia hongkongensis]|uniref:Hint domain-containing protein n=1 Tax=Fangia hongkongensis TaxID=270495 RepID=UPI00146D67CC|nr:Hint domain-containing protein [Fangia hongkongensis]MBK2124168.1 hypothetical protein [Fangia hongkongensis]
MRNTSCYQHKRVYQIGIFRAGQEETLYATGNHPFYIKEKGFVRVDQLEQADHMKLVSAHNAHLHIKAINETVFDKAVYDLTVENSHTFFVGKSACWVHNSNSNTGTQNQPIALDVDKTLFLKKRNGSGFKPPKNAIDVTKAAIEFNQTHLEPLHSRYQFGEGEREYSLYMNKDLLDQFANNSEVYIYSTGGWNDSLRDFLSNQVPDLRIRSLKNWDDVRGALTISRLRFMSKGRAAQNLELPKGTVLYDDQWHQVLGFSLFGPGRGVHVSRWW